MICYNSYHYYYLDFDIPDEWKPSSEPKLKSFKMITQNSYHGGKVPKPQLDLEGTPTCTCVPTNGGCYEESSCTNRMLYMECAPMVCPSLIPGCTKYCSNTVIQRQAFPVTEVFMSRSCGFGLKVMENIRPGKIVIEYMGQVITCDEGKRRMTTYKESDDFYFMSLGNGLMLDAKPMGSNARFANHSCDPNCALQKWNVLGETRLVIVAIKSITAGEEINYNYNYHNDDLGDIPRQPCMCGADNCSGTIGGRNMGSIEMIWIEKANVILSGGRRYTVEMAEDHLQSWYSMKENRQEETGSNSTEWNGKRQYNSSSSRHACLNEPSESISFNEISTVTEMLEPFEYRRLHSAVESAKAWKDRVRAYLNHESGKKYRTIKAKIYENMLRNAPPCLKLGEYVEIEKKLKACDKMERKWNPWIQTEDTNKMTGGDISKSNGGSSDVRLVFEEEKQIVSPSKIHVEPHMNKEFE